MCGYAFYICGTYLSNFSQKWLNVFKSKLPLINSWYIACKLPPSVNLSAGKVANNLIRRVSVLIYVVVFGWVVSPSLFNDSLTISKYHAWAFNSMFDGIPSSTSANVVMQSHAWVSSYCLIRLRCEFACVSELENRWPSSVLPDGHKILCFLRWWCISFTFNRSCSLSLEVSGLSFIFWTSSAVYSPIAVVLLLHDLRVLRLGRV